MGLVTCCLGKMAAILFSVLQLLMAAEAVALNKMMDCQVRLVVGQVMEMALNVLEAALIQSLRVRATRVVETEVLPDSAIRAAAAAVQVVQASQELPMAEMVVWG